MAYLLIHDDVNVEINWLGLARRRHLSGHNSSSLLDEGRGDRHRPRSAEDIYPPTFTFPYLSEESERNR